MPVGVHDIFYRMSLLRTVCHQSVQGADISTSPLGRLSIFFSFFCLDYAENNLLNQPVVLHPAYVTKEVQFSFHYSLHYIETFAERHGAVALEASAPAVEGPWPWSNSLAQFL